MPKVKTTCAYKVQSLTNLWKVLTINYIAICVTVRFLATNAFLLSLIKIRRNIKKPWAADLKTLSPSLRKRF